MNVNKKKIDLKYKKKDKIKLMEIYLGLMIKKMMNKAQNGLINQVMDILMIIVTMRSKTVVILIEGIMK